MTQTVRERHGQRAGEGNTGRLKPTGRQDKGKDGRKKRHGRRTQEEVGQQDREMKGKTSTGLQDRDGVRNNSEREQDKGRGR